MTWSGGARGVSLGTGTAGEQHGFNLTLEGQQPVHLFLAARFLFAEFEQGGAAQHLGGAGGILFAGKLEHQLVGPHGLKGGFRYTQTINPALQHLFHRFELLLFNGLDRPGGHHLEGELAAAAQIKAQLKAIAGEQGGGGDRKGQDQGQPSLLTCHLRGRRR